MFLVITTSVMILSPIMILSMKSWIMIWMFLEMSSMSFINMMKMKNSNEGTMTYFLAQTFGSMMILFSMMQSGTQATNMMTEKMTLTMGMMIKLGLIPFQQWFVMIGMEISMTNLLILSTIQKAAPFIMMSWSTEKSMTMMILTSSMFMSLMMQMAQQSMKKMIIYSSIFQTSWIMVMSFSNMIMSMMYFLIYSTIMMTVMKEMEKSETNKLTNQEPKMNMKLMINMVSMSGIPPMLGFIPKWMMFKTLTKESNMYSMMMLMIILSTISFFIYFRIFFSMWMKSKKSQNQQNTKKSMTIQMFMPITLMMML